MHLMYYTHKVDRGVGCQLVQNKFKSTMFFHAFKVCTSWSVVVIMEVYHLNVQGFTGVLSASRVQCKLRRKNDSKTL